MSTGLAWSIKNGDLDEVKKCLTKENVNSDLDGRKPLHYAADYGQREVVEHLLGVGADVNAVDTHGISPLLAAVWEGHTATVKLLLSKGAITDATAPDGKKYSECAEKAEIRELLMQAAR